MSLRSLLPIIAALATLLPSCVMADCASDLLELKSRTYIDQKTSNAMLMYSGLGLNDMGNYQMCRGVVGAKYCLAQVALGGNTMFLDTQGLCVPGSCDADTITTYLATQPAFASQMENTEVHCGNNNAGDLNTAAYLMIITLVILVVLVAVGTYLEHDFLTQPVADKRHMKTESDLLESAGEPLLEGDGSAPPPRREPSRGHKLVMAFSLIKNWQAVLSKNAGRKYASLDGLRAISLLWIILGHTFNFMFLTGLDNTASAYTQIGKKWTFYFVIGANFAVDTFLYLSGFLSTYVTLRKFARSRSGGFPVHLAVVHRYLRLTPCLAFVIFFFTGLVQFMADGPLWYKMKDMVGDCENNWWTSLLYISNFQPTEYINQCLPWTWYLPNDMQFFAVGMLLLLLYRSAPRLTIALTALMAAGSVAGNAVASSHYDYYRGGGDSQNQQYDKPYMRISPYLIGMLAAFWFNDNRNKVAAAEKDALALQQQQQQGAGASVVNADGSTDTRSRSNSMALGAAAAAPPQRLPGQLPKKYALALGTVCLALMYTAMMAGATNDNHQWTRTGFIINDAFSRTYFSIGLAGLTLLLLTEQLPLLDTFLSLPCWDPVAKLSYVMYLWHPIIIRFFYYSTTQLLHYSVLHTSVVYCGVVVITLVISLVTHLLVELPFATVERLLLFGGK